MTLECRSDFLGAFAVEFGENGTQRHLRNDFLFVQVLE